LQIFFKSLLSGGDGLLGVVHVLGHLLVQFLVCSSNSVE
jgi:hypothetical protein